MIAPNIKEFTGITDPIVYEACLYQAMSMRDHGKPVNAIRDALASMQTSKHRPLAKTDADDIIRQVSAHNPNGETPDTGSQIRKGRKGSWMDVTTEQVQEAVAGTLLEKVNEAFKVQTSPGLPLEMTLPKAIAITGAAMCGENEQYKHQADMDAATKSVVTRLIEKADHQTAVRGADRLRLKINTAGGQACNVYAMIVAESGSGKDVGYVADKLATCQGLSLGTSASASGILDSLV